ncbi:single-stranded DNA-binding protein [Nonomuraea purpurea]|uniref:Single-stranded DNA-binding protein n=1 Tax=Nonomuraea purpurea TaxID=1849276 RepID=A0ABV8G5F3_9ACTN
MNDIYITLTGNVAAEPRQYSFEEGTKVTSLKVLTSHRYFDKRTGQWTDGEKVCFTVRCWRALGDNVAASIRAGHPVVVSGKLRIREFGAEGDRRFMPEIEASAVGHDLRWGTGVFTKPDRSGGVALMSREMRDRLDEETRDWAMGTQNTRPNPRLAAAPFSSANESAGQTFGTANTPTPTPEPNWDVTHLPSTKKTPIHTMSTGGEDGNTDRSDITGITANAPRAQTPGDHQAHNPESTKPEPHTLDALKAAPHTSGAARTNLNTPDAADLGPHLSEAAKAGTRMGEADETKSRRPTETDGDGHRASGTTGESARSRGTTGGTTRPLGQSREESRTRGAGRDAARSRGTTTVRVLGTEGEASRTPLRPENDEQERIAVKAQAAAEPLRPDQRAAA